VNSEPLLRRGAVHEWAADGGTGFKQVFD